MEGLGIGDHTRFIERASTIVATDVLRPRNCDFVFVDEEIDLILMIIHERRQV